MRHVKLTDENHYTQNNTLWRPGKTVRIENFDPHVPLCRRGWLHSYRARTTREAQALAVLRAPGDNVSDAVQWVATPGGHQRHEALKSGSEELTVWRRLPRLVVMREQQAEVAIRIVLATPSRIQHKWDEWAESWLAGDRRTPFSYVPPTHPPSIDTGTFRRSYIQPSKHKWDETPTVAVPVTTLLESKATSAAIAAARRPASELPGTSVEHFAAVTASMASVSARDASFIARIAAEVFFR